MEPDLHQAEKKIWIDPELTFMPMEEIKSFNIPNSTGERILNDQAPYTGVGS